MVAYNHSDRKEQCAPRFHRYCEPDEDTLHTLWLSPKRLSSLSAYYDRFRTALANYSHLGGTLGTESGHIQYEEEMAEGEKPKPSANTLKDHACERVEAYVFLTHANGNRYEELLRTLLNNREDHPVSLVDAYDRLQNYIPPTESVDGAISGSDASRHNMMFFMGQDEYQCHCCDQ
mmetsp:Transcript_32903/g.50326  ORF Transcript_32903/g.50326 Transcript_32903/m.50326 type:complete len:176 (+) Transcript_32903:834-1361(+)